MTTKNILIVDDDINSLEMVEQFLSLKKYEVTPCLTFRDARREMAEGKFGAAVLDYYMPDTTGVEMMKAFRQIDPGLPVVILTGAQEIKLAVEAIKAGAFAYQVKPVDPDELYANLANAVQGRELAAKNEQLQFDLEKKFRFDNMVGDSGRMREVYNLTSRAARVRSNALITGETGCGKELIARAIHYNSDRKNGPFIRVNCAAVPEGLLEAELFGIEKNVATGVDARIGKFEAADGGTIFLDEIGDMKISTQAKVLRALQEREIERVGSVSSKKVDIRIIAATHRNLEAGIHDNTFRQDLYYRLNVLVIDLPPLKERREDIPDLVSHFTRKYCDENKLAVKEVTPDALQKMMAYSWPGNVRELENTIERAVVVGDGPKITPEALPMNIRSYAPGFFSMPEEDEPVNLEDAVAEFEKGLILSALRRNDFRQNKAAEELGVTERSIWYKIKKYGIDAKQLKGGEAPEPIAVSEEKE